MPYIEQEAILRGYDVNQSSGASASANDPVSIFKLKLLLCPSDPNPATSTYYGWTNYHTNMGSWVGFQDGMAHLVQTFQLQVNPLLLSLAPKMLSMA